MYTRNTKIRTRSAGLDAAHIKLLKYLTLGAAISIHDPKNIHLSVYLSIYPSVRDRERDRERVGE